MKFHYLLKITVLAALYLGAAKVGLLFSFVEGNVTLIWPPTGLALAALLLFGYRLWPGVALGAFLATISTGAPLVFTLISAIGNSLEALVGAYLMRRLEFNQALARVRDLISLIVLGGGLSAILSATIGVAGLCLAGMAPWPAYLSIWWPWWLGDTMGALLIAPVLLTWAMRPNPIESWPSRQWLEAGAVLLAGLGASLVIFGNWPASNQVHLAFVYLPFPVLLWAGLRFGPIGAATMNLIVNTVAVLGTVQGFGPFAGVSLNESLFLLWAFMGIASVTALVTAAITAERQQTGAALREVEVRYRALFDQSHDAVFMLNLEGRHLAANRRAAEMLGYTEAEIEGLSYRDISAEPVESEQVLARLLNGEYIPPFERIFRKKSGEHFSVEISVELVRNVAGRPRHIQSIVRDISGRKQAEEVLQVSEERLRLAVAAAQIGTWDVDLATRRVEWSDSYGALFGRGRDQFPPDEAAFFECVHPDDRELVRRSFGRAIAEDIPYECEFRVLWPDGAIHWHAALGRAQHDAQGRPIRMIGVGLNSTARKQAETTLRFHARRQEAAAQLAQTALTASLPRLFAEAMQMLAETLDVELCKVLELLPDGSAMHLVAGVGWRPDLVGQAKVSVGRESQAGFTLLSNAPVIVEDLRADERFSGPPLLTEHGVVSGMSVIIQGARGPWGVMGAHTRAHRRFTQDDVHFFETVAGILSGAIQRHAVEAALRESAERLRLAVQASNIGLWDWNLQTNEVAYSREWKSQLGYEEHEIGNEWSEWECRVHPDDLASALERIQSYLTRPEGAHEVEFRMRRKDGSYRWIYARAELVADESGKSVRMLGCHIDITERKRVEEALRKNEEFLSIVYKNSDIAIFVVAVSERGEYIYEGINPAHEKLVGLKNAEIAGRTPDDLVKYLGPEAIHYIKRLYDECVQTKETIESEFYAPQGRAQGWWFSRLTPLIDDKTGQVIRLIGSGLIITERKQAEEALRESEERFRQLAENINEVFWMTNPAKNRMLYISPAYERIWGRTCQSLYASPQDWLEAIHPEDRSRVEQAAMTRQVEGSYDEEYRIIRPDGSVGWVQDRAFPVQDATGRVVRIVGVAQDITERKRGEETRQKLEAQLRQAQKMEAIGRLAGGIAHDFNNILVPIIGYTELAMLELSPDDKLSADLKRVREAAERAAGLTRQILAFSRKQLLEMQVFDLNELVMDFKKMIQRLIGEDIEVQTSLDSALSWIKADKGQIEQMLLNLVVNARDAMPTGGRLIIETANAYLDEAYVKKYTDAQPPGPYVMLAVSDTGHGMDADIQQHIFEPFFTTKEQGKGTGLGLATVFGIVKQHGGNIWVYSEVGKGTTFKIYLPQAGETPPFAPKQISLPASVHGVETVLVVEDEAMVRKLVCETLAMYGYKIMEAPGPGDGFRLASEYKETIHLLLTDLIMPEMNGRELYQKVAAVHPNIKVLYMSGYTGDVIIHHGLLDEEVNFLQKPFTIQNLTQKIRRVLS